MKRFLITLAFVLFGTGCVDSSIKKLHQVAKLITDKDSKENRKSKIKKKKRRKVKVTKRKKRYKKSYSKSRKRKGIRGLSSFAGPLVSFVVNSNQAFEDEGLVDIELMVNKPSPRAMKLNFKVIGGTAEKGKDYKFKNYSIKIPPNSTRATIPVQLFDSKGKAEEDESIKLEITKVKNGRIGKRKKMEFIILDNDNI